MSTQSAYTTPGVFEKWILPLTVWTLPIIALGLALRPWIPELASEHGAGIDRMLYYLLFTVGSLVLVGNAVLGYFVFRFSRAKEVTFRTSTWKQERTWSIIPIVVMSLVAEGGVFVLGLPVWSKYYAATPPEDAVVIEVLAEQFAWNIRYPGADGAFGRTSPSLYAYDNPTGLDADDAAAQDDLVLRSRIVLPVGRPAHVRLKSKDVLHSFFLPHHRVKQDAVPGMTINLWFVPTQTGTYELACTELCGSGHYTMRGIVEIVSEEEFEKWKADTESFLAY